MLLDPSLFAVYLGAATLLALSPGPDTMFVLANAGSRGARAGVAATLGIASGGLIHAALAALGISAVLAASPLAFDVLRIGGALYLIYMGAQALRDWWRNRKGGAAPALPLVTGAMAYRRGLLTNLLNPKVVVFYVAFLPQFANPDLGHVPLQIALLALTHNLIGTLWLATIAVAAGRASAALARSSRMRARLDAAAGLVYLALAFRILLIERRA